MMALPASSLKRRMPRTEDYLTVAETADKLGFHPVSIRRMIKDGRLKAIKVGYATMVSKESIEAYQKETAGMERNDPRRKTN
jgi:excisionase family DNA binding protein